MTTDVTTYSLQAACTRLRRVVAFNYPQAIWVVAEVAEADVSKGHRFLSLVEQGTEGIAAQASAIVWGATYRALTRRLGPTLDTVLQAGRQIRLFMRPEIHEQHGLRWLVEDIDPTYTLGKLALQREQTLLTLHNEQLLDRNRQYALPNVLQRVAVVSSEEAAGRQDFLQQLAENEAGYAFTCTHFQASVQGKSAPAELMGALHRVAAQAAHFDCVVLLRGGGARLDLTAFDDLALCRTLAQMPLPVLTGIGHEVDESVADVVAHSALRTPTAVAAFLVAHNAHFEQKMAHLIEQVRQAARQHWLTAHQALAQHAWTLPFVAKQGIRQAQQTLHRDTQMLHQYVNTCLAHATAQIQHTAQLYEALHPQNALARGYAWVTRAGKIVHAATEVCEGERLTLYVAQGQIETRVVETHTDLPQLA